MIQRLKGTYDVLPGEIEKWQYVEGKAKEVFENFGYKEIRTPVIEATELFQRGVGDTTDVVEKEMYVFDDKGGRSVALRPEGTAGVIRAYLENGMSSLPSPQKLFYRIPVYRYENVQKGRQREFNQIGCEMIGTGSYKADVELIIMLDQFVKKLGITEYEIHLNSIGCKECRAKYREALREFIKPNLDKYCDTCKGRYDRNPMRILDCKVEADKEMNQNAPVITDYLCDECKANFEKIQNELKELGIEFQVDSGIVRGLDYYTRTVFEFISKTDGLTILGGGRYDGLVEELGGPSTPALGFGVGEERILNLMKDTNVEFPAERTPDLSIVAIGGKADTEATKIAAKLRENGKFIEKDVMDRGVNAQFKYANKIGAKYVVTIGDDELASGKVQLKNMESGETEEISISEIGDKI